MKKFILSSLVVVAVVALVSCQGHSEQENGSGDPVTSYQGVDTVPMLIMQIQKCARLYTADYHVHKIVTHDDVLRLKGSILQRSFNIPLPLGDRKIAIPIDAKLKAYIDLSAFSEKNIERHGERITVTLPDPQVVMTSSKIDQENIKQYVALARAHFSDREMTNYEQQGRAAIIESIPQLGILETARANTAKVLVPMLTEMGFKEENITIAFRKQYNTGDMIQLLKMED